MGSQYLWLATVKGYGKAANAKKWYSLSVPDTSTILRSSVSVPKQITTINKPVSTTPVFKFGSSLNLVVEMTTDNLLLFAPCLNLNI